MINVHPSLLPAFPGLSAIEQALEYGVKVFGVTVHFVDAGVDSGPVILQRAIELPDARDPARCSRRCARSSTTAAAGGAPVRAGALRPDPANPRRIAFVRIEAPIRRRRRACEGQRWRGVG